MKLYDAGMFVLVLLFTWGLVQAGIEEGKGYDTTAECNSEYISVVETIE